MQQVLRAVGHVAQNALGFAVHADVEAVKAEGNRSAAPQAALGPRHVAAHGVT
ncbi:MAG TPA: hypothetical protein VHQ47_05950 [Phycisphaerae bacterium]|nr:hypothetical protein [Phycisphaerae bacterium]